MRQPRIFLDTSALFAAVWSAQGGARALARLGELCTVSLVVSSQVLTELDRTVNSKASQIIADVAVILNEARLTVVDPAPSALVNYCESLTGYANDAHVLAAAWHAHVDYFVTLDRKHFLSNEVLIQESPFPIGTPGDCLGWLRTKLAPDRRN